MRWNTEKDQRGTFMTRGFSFETLQLHAGQEVDSASK